LQQTKAAKAVQLLAIHHSFNALENVVPFLFSIFALLSDGTTNAWL